MSKIFLIVDKQSKVIVDCVTSDEDSDWSYETENPDKYLVVEPNGEEIYLGIDKDEYIQSKGIFQPIEPEDESWVKDEFGVWTVMYDRPSPSHFWYDITSDWYDAKVYESSKTDAEILNNKD